MTMACLVAPGLPAAPAPQTHLLHPGDVVCAARGDRLETLLGSCVAVILTDPRRTVGAMGHIVHPAGHGRGDTAFGEAALQAMRALLAARGMAPDLCHAWVLGGGNMFPSRYDQAHVGQANARWALQALQRRGVPVIGHDLGGQRYRRVSWTVGEGDPQVSAMEMPA